MKKITLKLAALTLSILTLLSVCGMSYIKWVDCKVSYNILSRVYDYCRACENTDKKFVFSDAVAYIATRNGNRFSTGDEKYFKQFVKDNENAKPYDGFADNKYFIYNQEAYGAILKNFVGEYVEDGTMDKKFGMTAYFPIAKGHWYNHYDDFGNGRSFGFKRKHLGHDISGSVGAPIVAVEGGRITELGWNRYGGWRVGILSLDSQRYYYYAHLRKDKPYAPGLMKGAQVNAGDVIGFLGNTGYSDKENVNLKNCAPHLHFGMQLIFDPSQVDGNGEIWIDVYAITRFLEKNRIKVVKDEEGNYKSVGQRRIVPLTDAKENA